MRLSIYKVKQARGGRWVIDKNHFLAPVVGDPEMPKIGDRFGSIHSPGHHIDVVVTEPENIGEAHWIVGVVRIQGENGKNHPALKAISEVTA